MEEHDYDVFGQEVGAQAGTQPKRFAGKERDGETGWGYFGARYYGSKVGRFTTTDPLYTWKENLIDPQRWNRYAYSRNNPLRYVDPTGAVLELVGGHRQEAFSMLTNLVGGGGLSRVERDGRTFVEASGSLKGGMGAAVAGIIGAPKTATLNVTTEDTRVGGRTLDRWGGGAVAGSEESLNGLTEIYVALSAGALASRAHDSIGYLNISSDRIPLRQSNESVLAHELGHARGNLLGLPVSNSAATFGLAVTFEMHRGRAKVRRTSRRSTIQRCGRRSKEVACASERLKG